MTRATPSLAWLFLACACGAGTPPTLEAPDVSNPHPPGHTSPTSKVSAPEAPSARAQNEIARVLARVSTMRQLPILGPVQGRVIDRSTMLEQVKAQVKAQVPADAIRGESAFLSAFGFIPQGYDYEAQVYRLMETQLAGYYDPDRKALFLMEDLSGPEAEVTLAHELVHALQDQHYTLGPRLKYQPNGNDARAAVHCLAEGDATSLMLDYTLEEGGMVASDIPDAQMRIQISASMAVSPDLASFPRVLRDSLVSPYLDGVLFVHALRRRGGWALVDEVWRNPPTTTEQVLHIEKLDTREPAVQVPIPAPPPEGSWSLTHSDVYGEQGLRVALEEWMPRRVAARAAAGWAGDRAAVFERDSGVTVAAWHVLFDPAKAPRIDAEAKEAFDAIAKGWNQRKPGPVCQALGNGQVIALAREGRSLALVTSDSPPQSTQTPSGAVCSRLTLWASAIAASMPSSVAR